MDKLPRDAAEARAIADDCISMWSTRDSRQDEDQRLWELSEDSYRKKYEDQISVPDNALHLDRFADEVSRAELTVSVAPEHEDDRPAAQRIEDACYWALDELKQRHVGQLHAPWGYEVGHFTGLRGWIVAECLANTGAAPGDAYPWRIRLLDPHNIYPDSDDGPIGLIVHRYVTTYETLRNYWGEAVVAKAFDETTRTTYGQVPRMHEPVTCYGYYSKTELAIAVDGGGWLKEPVAHGYSTIPLIIGISPGGAAYRRTQGEENTHQEYIGASLLRTLKGVVDSKHKIAMLMRRVLTKTGAPPLFAALSDPKATADDIATEPNEVTIGRPGDSVNPIVPPPISLQHATALLSMLTDAEGRAGLPPNIWGETGPTSGYDRLKAMGSSMANIMSRMEMLRWWYQGLLKCMLDQFARYGTQEITFLSTDRQTGLRTATGRLNPWEVQNAAVRLECKWGRLAHVDLNAMGNLAAQLTDRGLISHEYALGELLGVDNPTKVIKAALNDQFYKDPAMLRLRVLMEKMGDSMDPLGAQLATMLFHKEFQAFQLMVTQPPPPPPQPQGSAPLPGPGAQQPPLPNQGPPPQVLPPAAATGAGLPPNVPAVGPPQVGAGLQLA